jgi:hypothetical protein
MENPATWGEAERIVDRVLTEFFANQEMLVTNPAKVMFGYSLERLITNALREAGLLTEGDAVCAVCGGALEETSEGPDAGLVHASDTDDTHVPRYGSRQVPHCRAHLEARSDCPDCERERTYGT